MGKLRVQKVINPKSVIRNVFFGGFADNNVSLSVDIRDFCLILPKLINGTDEKIRFRPDCFFG